MINFTSRRVLRLIFLTVLLGLLTLIYQFTPTSPPVSPFRIDPTLWVVGGPQPLQHMPEFPFDVPEFKKRGMKVPNSVHYILFSPSDEPVRMRYWQYLSIRSAMVIQRPHRIYIHCDHTPVGPWWDLVSDEVVVNTVIVPDKIWDQKIGLPAHKSDVLRILALQAIGGIYLDLDIFVVRPFDDLMYAPCTMGLQGALDGKYALSEGLGNGVVVAAPGAPFLERWLEGYHDFHGEWYNYNGVRRPYAIAKTHPDEIQLLNGYAFFYPHFDDNERIYTRDDFDWNSHTGYTYHAWFSLAKKWIDPLTPFDVLETDTAFHRLMRRYMGPRDREVWLQDLKANEPGAGNEGS